MPARPADTQHEQPCEIHACLSAMHCRSASPCFTPRPQRISTTPGKNKALAARVGTARTALSTQFLPRRCGQLDEQDVVWLNLRQHPSIREHTTPSYGEHKKGSTPAPWVPAGRHSVANQAGSGSPRPATRWQRQCTAEAGSPRWPVTEDRSALLARPQRPTDRPPLRLQPRPRPPGAQSRRQSETGRPWAVTARSRLPHLPSNCRRGCRQCPNRTQ